MTQAIREVERPWNEGLDGLFLDQGPQVAEDEILEYLVPEDNEVVCWEELVKVVSQAEAANRLATLRRWLTEQRTKRLLAAKDVRSWGKNQERDQLILSSLGCQMGRQRICMELDRQGIPVGLPALERYGFQKWGAAWANPEGRQAIQRLFSKLASR